MTRPSLDEAMVLLNEALHSLDKYKIKLQELEKQVEVICIERDAYKHVLVEVQEQRNQLQSQLDSLHSMKENNNDANMGD